MTNRWKTFQTTFQIFTIPPPLALHWPLIKRRNFILWMTFLSGPWCFLTYETQPSSLPTSRSSFTSRCPVVDLTVVAPMSSMQAIIRWSCSPFCFLFPSTTQVDALIITPISIGKACREVVHPFVIIYNWICAVCSMVVCIKLFLSKQPANC